LTDLSRFRGTDPTKLILLAEPAERERLLEKFSREIEGRASLARSEPEYLEIMAPGVNKGAALRALADYFEIATDEIVAVGDSDNDREMLETAGIGVALANARDSTKAVADKITNRTNNEAGLAEAIREYVLDSL
jgi:hydroxymethylpyrimidine pyrophosphatase-like HAD family hydrolase